MRSRPRPPCRSSTRGSRCAAASASSPTTCEHLPAETGRTRRARRRERDVLLATDQAAFDEFWAFDRDGLRQAARATPSSQFRITPRPGSGRVRAVRSRAHRRLRPAARRPPRRAGPGRGRGAAHRRSAVVAQARRDARVRQHAVRQRPRLRAVPARRLHADARRALCPRTHAVTTRPRVARRRPRRCSPSRVAVPATSARAARAADPQFALLAQPAWTPVHGDVTLRLDIPASLLAQDQDVQLRMRMHQPVTTTTAFDRTIEGDRLGNRIDTKTVAGQHAAARHARCRAASPSASRFR